MLKDTRFLIGLGIGLILGAILLQLMNVAVTGVNPMESYTVTQLEDIADSLDYHVIDKSVVIYTQAELDDIVEEAKNSVAAAQSVPDVEQKTTTKPVIIQTPVKQPEAEVTTETVADKKTSYLVQIESGMATADVTKLLVSAGLIADGNSFEQELSRRKLNQSIQIGKFEFATKPSLTELIHTITSQ